MATAKSKSKTGAKPEGETQAFLTVVASDAIRHDGIDYAPGETLDVTPEAAAVLQAIGAIGAIEPSAED